MNDKIFNHYSNTYHELLSSALGICGNGSYFANNKVNYLRGTLSEIFGDNNICLLDAGSGFGQISTLLNMKNIKFINLDISIKMLSQHVFSKKTGNSVCGGALSIPIKTETMDAIVCMNLFHHLSNQSQLLLREINRCLKTRGILVAFEQNPYNLATRWIVNRCPFDSNCTMLSLSTLQAQIEKVNLEIIFCKYLNFFPEFLKILQPLERYLNWLPLGGQYMVVSRKR